MKLVAIFLLFGVASAFVQRDYGGPDYQDYVQDEGYESYDDEQSEYLNQVLRHVRDAVQRARLYSEGKLQEAQEILVGYQDTNSEPDEYAEQLIQQVKSQARQLQRQVYEYLQYSPGRYSQYSQYFESDEYGRYEDQGQEQPSGSRLRSVLREIRDVLQTTQAYSERKLEKATQILEQFQQSGEQPSQHTRQLIQEVKSEASALQIQVYQSLQYSRQQYSEGYEYYGEQGENGQYGSQVEAVLSEVQGVLQSAQYYLQRKLQVAQQIFNYYEQSDEEPSRQVRQLVQETKSRSRALSKQVYTYTQYFQHYFGEYYEENPQYSQQRYGQYYEESSEYPQQRYGPYYGEYSRYAQQSYGPYYGEYSRYEQQSYGPYYEDDSQYPYQRYSQNYEEDSQYPQQRYGRYYGGDSQYSQQQYGGYYGYAEYAYPQQQYGRYSHYDQYPQGYGGYSEGYPGHLYERQLVTVLTEVRNVLENVQYRSQQGLREAQNLFSEQQQTGSQSAQHMQFLVQRIRFAVSAVQQDVYGYLQYEGQNYDYDVRYNYRSQLQQIREMLQQGADSESIDSYVRENLPSGISTTQTIRRYLQEDRYQLQRYLDYVLEEGYSDSGHSSSEQYRVGYYFQRRYGLPVRDSYYQFAKYLVQTFRRDLSSASDTETVREIAKHFLRQVDGLSEGVLQHAMEFFREYRTQAGEYYYRAVEDAVRQQLDA